MTDPMVVVDRLTRRFGALTAVDSLGFEVRRGELFGIAGPDGAGKTTLFRMLSGVLSPTSGDATLNGVSIARNAEKAKYSIAYMSQRFGLYTDLTVLENLHFYADLYRVPKGERAKRLERVFHFSGLSSFQDRLAGKLSGGMKQKLGLSCALIHQPEILLLDEPTFGVDPVSRRDLWIIIHEMVSEGVTTIVSTAYLDEAERFDRMALLHLGKLIALDTPAGLLEKFDGEILSVKGVPVRQAKQLCERLPGVSQALIFGDKLHLMVDTTERAASVKSALMNAGLQPAEITAIRPSLEEVMIQLSTSTEEVS
jgi:ABC-2 type transport system ATP-binding protein